MSRAQRTARKKEIELQKKLTAKNTGQIQIQNWRDKEIGLWLQSLGLEMYIRTFRDNEIWGDVLSLLTDKHLKEMGIRSVGHRITLLKNIRGFKQALRITNRNKVLKEFMDWKCCNVCRCFDLRYRVTEAAIVLVQPGCTEEDLEYVDFSQIEDISLRVGCFAGYIEIISSDQTVDIKGYQPGRFVMRLWKGRVHDMFNLIKNLWESDQDRVGRTQVTKLANDLKKASSIRGGSSILDDKGSS